MDPSAASVEVVIRLQPPLVEHLVPLSQNSIACMGKLYTFDTILGHDTCQQEVF